MFAREQTYARTCVKMNGENYLSNINNKLKTRRKGRVLTVDIKCGGRNKLRLFLVFSLGSLHFDQVFTLIAENF